MHSRSIGACSPRKPEPDRSSGLSRALAMHSPRGSGPAPGGDVAASIAGEEGGLLPLGRRAECERQALRALRGLAREARRGDCENLEVALAVGQPPAAV